MSYGREGERPNIVQGASWSMHDHVQCFHKNLSQVPPTYFFGVGASAIPLDAATCSKYKHAQTEFDRRL